MIKVRNKIIPFKGFQAITIWPFIFIRAGLSFNEVDERHENIHGKQQLELLVVFFYIWYICEWLIRLFQKGNAYRNISFEREAYANEADENYLSHRKHYAWIPYIKKQK